MRTLVISAKDLGELAKPDFCSRCFWLKRHARSLPFQIFPGIFSSIDAYTKKVVHAWMDRNDGAPFGLEQLGKVVDCIDPPSHHTFRMEVPRYDILLTGEPDGILQLADDSIAIIDYKTARFTPAQDEMMPIYVVQLNGYAAIAEHLDYGKVSKLALVYAEPVTDEETASQPETHTEDGFTMPFSISIHPVELDLGMLEPLYRRAREIYDLPEPPDGRTECEDCRRLDTLMHLTGRA